MFEIFYLSPIILDHKAMQIPSQSVDVQ